MDTIEEAIADIRAGKVVIVVDDEDRENEGDFVCAAECVTPEIINFMATHGRGLICAPITEQRAKELELDLMVQESTALHATAFTVSIDYKGKGCTTGISAYDRSTGIRALVESDTKASDFGRPGHIFPLKAKNGGVLRRTGHTEAAIDLAKLAGFYPAGVLVEILNDNGTMARLPELHEIATKHGLKLISIEDLVAYRLRTESLISKEIEVKLGTRWGDVKVIAYQQSNSSDIHLAIVMGSWNEDEPVLVRVHSSREMFDIVGTLVDGNHVGTEEAMKVISEEGAGVLLYMRHKMNSNLLQALQYLQSGATLDESEQRDFGVGAQILRDLNVSKIKLITNQPKKRVALEGYGLEIVDHVHIS